jgi:AMIN domain
MHRFSRVCASGLFAAALCAALTLSSAAQVSVRSVRVLGTKDTVEIEVESSGQIVPQSQILTGPDRLVVDFPNAIPSNSVRNQSVERGEVKDVRVGLFQSKPPITRVVLDLESARSYQVFPNGRTVMIKVVGGTAGATDANAYSEPGSHANLVAANYTAGAEAVRAEPPMPNLRVWYREGLLKIHADKVTLSEVLYAVAQRTGADISIAAGAEQELVAAEIDYAPAAEVLSRLLNGSRFNFLILNAADNPRALDKVILSTRTESGGYMPPAPNPSNDDQMPPEPPVARNEAVPPANGPMPNPPPPQAEMKDEGPEQ